MFVNLLLHGLQLWLLRTSAVAPIAKADTHLAHLRLLHGNRPSGPDLPQKFDVIIAANASSVCNVSRPQLRRQMRYDGMQTLLSPSPRMS